MESMRLMAGLGSSATADATWWKLHTVGEKALRWLWPGHVPLGKVTLLIGDPGRGKSLLALDMAARVTRGAAWPDQAGGSGECEVAGGGRGGACGEGEASVEEGRSALVFPIETSDEPLDPGLAALLGVVEWPREEAEQEAQQVAGEGEGARGTDAHPCVRTAEGGCATPVAPAGGGCGAPRAPLGSVVLLSAEDDPGDTILPRLRAAGGDPERVVVLRSLRRREDSRQLTFSLARDLSLLDCELRARGDVRLVVFDPLTAYLGGLHGLSNTQVRDLMAPVKELAESRRVAIVGISHLTKKAEVAMMYRAMGSLAFVAASRSVWAVGPDRREPGRMLFLPVKCNLVGGAQGLAYRIVGSDRDPSVPVLAWEAEPVAEGAEEAFASTRRAPAAELAMMWLRGLLAAGPRTTRDVERLAAAAGISPTALRKGRRALGVESCPQGKRGDWLVRLPGDAARVPMLPKAGAEGPGEVGGADGPLP